MQSLTFVVRAIDDINRLIEEMRSNLEQPPSGSDDASAGSAEVTEVADVSDGTVNQGDA
jgi:hypothetical protein